MLTRVFISYSHHDQPWVELLVAAVRNLNIEVYVYNHDIEPGRPLAEKLQHEIREADAVLVLISQASLGAQYVQQEIGFALGHSKPVFPLVTPDVSDDQLAMLMGVEYITFDPANPQQAMADLTNVLHRFDLQRHVDIERHEHQLERERRENLEGLLVGALLALFGLALYLAAREGTV